jgi:hypothetical protein
LLAGLGYPHVEIEYEEEMEPEAATAVAGGASW